MISSTGEFLAYFDGVHKRALRDIAALPPAAESWRPPGGQGEGGWDIRQLVAHIAAGRLYFARAYRDEGWIYDAWDGPLANRADWIAALEQSAVRFHALLDGTPDDWLRRKIEAIDTPGLQLSGWRFLLMMVEHEVHHRSQIDTYAGLNGWDVPQIYGRSAEEVLAQRDEQLRRHATQ
jgi:uncharacterized damage-inducible protein DinB